MGESIASAMLTGVRDSAVRDPSGRIPGAFGVASAITIIPLQTMIATSGYEHTFFWFGLIQGLGLLVLSFIIRAPRKGEAGVAPYAGVGFGSYGLRHIEAGVSGAANGFDYSLGVAHDAPSDERIWHRLVREVECVAGAYGEV